MKKKAEILPCTMDDFNEITQDVADFWGSDRTLHLHHPYLIYEFGNTAFVIREKGQVVAYLFGFFSQTESVAYIHLLGVRESCQRQGYGQRLYEHFTNIAKQKGVKKLKAITTPTNLKSVSFHKNKIGMTLIGEPDSNGINVVKNYSGVDKDRVVFIKEIK